VATVTITINPVNDAPVAVEDDFTTDEDVTLNVSAPGVLGNDADIDDDSLTAVLDIGPISGTLTLNVDGSFQYAPDKDFNGIDSFTYKANDGIVDSNVTTVTISINPTPDAPVTMDDDFTTNEDVTLNVSAPGVLENDTDIDDDSLTTSLDTGPISGTLTLNADGSFQYTPHTDFNGTDSFTYMANDGIFDSNVATVTITITPVNDGPMAVEDNFITNEDVTLNVSAPGVLNNDTDIDNDSLTAVLDTGPISGTLTLNLDGSFQYTPDKDFNGTDSFTYMANDGIADSNVITVTITINPVNDSPVTVDDEFYTDEEEPLNVSAPGVLSNDTDAENNILTASKLTNPIHGTLKFYSDGSFEYIPYIDFFGTDSFKYIANDGLLNSEFATVTITVNQVNDGPPVAVEDAYTTDEDVILNVAAPGVLVNDTDIDGDTLTAVLDTGPISGTLTLNQDGSFQYTPDANFNGTDTFTYVANDGFVDSNVVAVTIQVDSVDDIPVAVDDSYITKPNTSLIVNAPGVLQNDTDGDGDTLTVTLMSDPGNGVLTFHLDGSFEYIPNDGFIGTDTFTYIANDGTYDSNTATVTIATNYIVYIPILIR
jgi:VCBS repeat-containing protein